jgi:hypothetical protein
MKRQWQVARQFQTCADGQRRWDRAFQLLLEWTAPVTQEVTDANRSLSACLNHMSNAGSDNCSTTGTATSGSVAKNILAAFHSGDEQAGITTSCVASEFLQQIPNK